MLIIKDCLTKIKHKYMDMKDMGLISRLEDLVIEVDTEYQKKMEEVIREIAPGMPEENVHHAAEVMCTDREGDMNDLELWILKEEDRPFERPYLKWLLADRMEKVAEIHKGKDDTYAIDKNYWCATCGSHDHKEDSKTGYCWHCDMDNWVKEDGADVGI